ncbi:hypothetical protein KCP71_21410 [Salmonella enterica subsp. enterica]|nr:hypothetical protein KCP71_21410 [Salmonella enterica subsp. enterica]
MYLYIPIINSDREPLSTVRGLALTGRALPLNGTNSSSTTVCCRPPEYLLTMAIFSATTLIGLLTAVALIVTAFAGSHSSAGCCL